MKKILVSGCANCPFVKIRLDKNGRNLSCECTHPSFAAVARFYTLTMGADFIVIRGINNAGADVSTMRPNYYPDWCPLPNEIEVYSPTCTSID